MPLLQLELLGGINANPHSIKITAESIAAVKTRIAKVLSELYLNDLPESLQQLAMILSSRVRNFEVLRQ